MSNDLEERKSDKEISCNIHESNSSDDDERMDASSDGEGPGDMEELEECWKAIELVKMNPRNYDAHVQCIQVLKKHVPLMQNELHLARERFSDEFPLTADIWLEWLQDELRLLLEQVENDESDSNDDTRTINAEEWNKVQILHEKSLEDYLSIALWKQYLHFVLLRYENGHASYSCDAIREKFELATTAAGSHFTQGHEIWAMYRNFEKEKLSELEGSSSDDRIPKSEWIVQENRLRSLYSRQLSIPLEGNDLVHSEFCAWNEYNTKEQSQAIEREKKLAQQRYNTSMDKAKTILRLEERLRMEPNSLEAWEAYLAHEMNAKDYARVQMLYERAVAQLSLEPRLWIQYIEFCLLDLSVLTVALRVCNRGLRNVTWSGELWSIKMKIEESMGAATSTDLEAMFDKALLKNVLASADDYLQTLLAYCDYHRRRVISPPLSDERKDELASLHAAFEKSMGFIQNSFPEWKDGMLVLQRYAIHCEHFVCQDSPAAHRIWEEILKIHGDRMDVWVTYINEIKMLSSWHSSPAWNGKEEEEEESSRPFGDARHGWMMKCRSLFKRASFVVKDYPEVILETWLAFERELGTLTSYWETQRRVTKRKAELRVLWEKKRKRKVEKDDDDDEGGGKGGGEDFKEKKKKKTTPTDWETKNAIVQSRSSNIGVGVGAEAIQTKAKAKAKEGKRNEVNINQTKTKSKTTTSVSHESTNTNLLTLFVCQLSKSGTEKDLHRLFENCGGLKDIRIVKKKSGASRGFAYIEFDNEESLQKGLALDGTKLNEQAMSVKRSNPTIAISNKLGSSEHAGTEANGVWKMNAFTLYVAGVDDTTSEQVLRDFFVQFGEPVEVIVMRDKRGKAKGYALVEFHDQRVVQQLLDAGEGLFVDNQPRWKLSKSRFSATEMRKQQAKARDFKQKKEEVPPFQKTKAMGKEAQTSWNKNQPKQRISSLLMPRTLRRKPSDASSPKRELIHDQPKTNADFQNLFKK